MSIKPLVQIFILILMISIIGAVYYKYFETKNNIVEEINSSELANNEKLKDLEKKISDLELKNAELNNKIENNKKIDEIINQNLIEEKNIELEKKDTYKNKEVNKENKEETNENKKVEILKNEINENKDEKISKNKITKNKKIKNLVKDVEYTSIDQKGNKFNLLASSGRSNEDNNNILDLVNVRGKITSETRDTIYIVSDFANYNSVNLNSKFYENVIINYQDKEITCENFDINMETNKAIAYNNVIVTDPKSIMKAGIVEFDLKTKDININPENASTDIEVITN